ncbi:MAG: serine/threonine protein kinase [Proteobacteria bacterium]|nr:serine/threonine protein kinase [Pseudomonadota bacterium]
MEKISERAVSQEPSAYQSYDEKTSEQDNDVAALQRLIADRYQVIKKLGKGSQGCVFLAETNDLHKKVAIKQLLVQSVKDWKQYDLFQREANVLKRLRVPGVAKLHETIEKLDNEPPMALIVQDYIEGEPLQKFIANGHRFQISQIGDILLQLLNILDKLHHSDPPVVHRDIKPSNIILNYVENDTTPQVHIIDFGAVANPQVKGGGSTVVGTYGYMSPEQLMGNATPASDLYSLAIVAVYLLSGVPPEELETKDFHVLIDPHLQHLPHQITAFLRKMLEPHAEDRITDYDQLREFFTALKKQQFDKIPITASTLDKEKYALDKVYSYHQQGNIILWQELSDKTPRKLDNSVKKVFKRNIKTADLSGLLGKFILTLVVGVVMLLAVAMNIMMMADSSNGHYPFIFSIGIILVIIVSYIMEILNKRRAAYYSNFLYNPEQFFKNARKSMATVNRIEYKSIVVHQFQATPGLDINEMINQTYSPTWLVTYGFNPPDDSSPDILIRTFETHVEPDFKEGDLIPILYLIDHDDNGEHVYSTPYPIPVADKFYPTEE